MSTTTIRKADPPAGFTPDDLLSMGSDGKGFELVDGQLVEKAMGIESSAVNRRVSKYLGNFADEYRLGEVLESEAGYQCFDHDPNRVRKPDVSFVRKERLPAEGLPEGWFRIAPDIAVQVVSPNDIAYDLEEKLADYRSAGVPLIWVVYPNRRTVQVYAGGSEVPAVLHESDSLTGSDVLPGFSVQVAELFPQAPGDQS